MTKEINSLGIKSLWTAVNEFKKDYIILALTRTKGNMSQAAELLERNRSEFYRTVARLGINPKDYREKEDEQVSGS